MKVIGATNYILWMYDPFKLTYSIRDLTKPHNWSNSPDKEFLDIVKSVFKTLRIGPVNDIGDIINPSVLDARDG